ncbi:retrovirus-related pol polyprotein from transposon TNT 1-94 [Tanacetum coccineum]
MAEDEAKPTTIKAENWALLDRQALGALRLSLGKNMNEGASIADHVNEFNSILSRLMSIDIKFDDEVQALLLLSSLPESWSGIVTVVSGSTVSTKLKFDKIRDLILGEDIRRKTFREYSNSLLSAKDKDRGRKQEKGQKQNRSRSKSKTRGQSKNRQDITCWNYNQKVHFQNQCSKRVTSRGKEVNMATGYYDEALVCCVENTIDDRIMDSGASFHATYCKEELERFKLRSGKIHLADDKTLEIAGVGDVVLKMFFGTSWTLKDVRHMSKKGMKILASKGRIPDLQKAVVGFCEPCVLGKQKKASFVKSGNTRKLQRLELVHTDVYGPISVASIGGSRYYVTFIDDCSRKFIKYCAMNGIRMLKIVPETPQQNGVAERMNRTLNKRAKSMRLHAGLPKMFWEDSVTTATYLLN